MFKQKLLAFAFGLCCAPNTCSTEMRVMQR